MVLPKVPPTWAKKMGGGVAERDYLRLKPLFNLSEIGTELRKLIGHSLRPVSDVAEESDNGNEEFS